MNQQIESQQVLRTLCGAIHYTLTRYGSLPSSARDWQLLCGWLHVPAASSLVVRAIDSKHMELQIGDTIVAYDHSDFHSDRSVSVTTLS